MEWVLIISLYSTQDVFLQEHITQKECNIALKQFKQTHKNDNDIREVQCEKAVIRDDGIVITKNNSEL